MSQNTLSVDLPEGMRGYLDERVRSGEYGDAGEYLRDLIRRDQRDQAGRRFRGLIADGIDSGEARPLTEARLGELRRSALGADR